MRLTPLRRSGLLGATAVAAVATLALVTTAFAQPDKPAPVSGDDRAVAYAGNVDIEHKDACTVGGLTGTPIAPGEFTFTGGVDKQDLDITAGPTGVTVTGIVVKGGDAYNVYLAPKLGALPWNDLRSPDKNDNVPAISHWYGCGIKDTTTTTISTTATTTSTSTVTQSSSPSSTTSTTTTTTTSGEVAPTTTTTVAPVPVANEDDLASTGFGSAWLLGLGAALVAGGAAVLLVMRRRRA
ncbi:LPXTG cell wall anchor domain-containing protein [Lentzea sp. BCCO 10_0798]|uniref:LPXTG cell wall anchor domain-containing protein n=1 Tax=Lentzea kristufekii TaxID=3095430 RepID=A0ABU4TX06_9PSEU|nr:LPXTG cell wall anchor domain-containing protein [Lentzea sp. BCCO 10_0798]MDX8052574.1 LPXTG cell wall anchor domain-containing protein [Lentzea sp. BCCO 10_0798]